MTCDCSDLMESLLFLLNEELYVKDLCIGPLLRLWQSGRSNDSDWTRLMARTGMLDTPEIRVELTCLKSDCSTPRLCNKDTARGTQSPYLGLIPPLFERQGMPLVGGIFSQSP